MSKTLIEDTILTSLADKIREKLGITDTFLPSAMDDKIGEISAGEGVYAWKRNQAFNLSVSAAVARTTYTLSSPTKIDSIIGITAKYPTGETFEIVSANAFEYNGTQYTYTMVSTTDYEVKFYTLGKLGTSATLVDVKAPGILDYVTSDDETAYPENGTGDDGFVYEMVKSLISFTISGTSYQAVDGMTWAEWCDSDYNTTGAYVTGGSVRYVYAGEEYHISNMPNLGNSAADTTIVAGFNYTANSLGPV